MRKIILVALIAASMPLAACTNPADAIYSASAKAQGSADTLYIAAEKAGEALVAAGVITVYQFKEADNKAYAALLVFRQANVAVRAAASAGGDTAALIAAEVDALAKFNAALRELQKLGGVSPQAATTP